MKKYCKCNISLKKVLQYCKSCNKQYFANTLCSAFRKSTEYGMCCMITPNLDFNPNKLKTKDYSSGQFYDIQRGFANVGMSHGLQVTLDMEHYDHAMNILDSNGFKMGLSNARDKMMVGNQGFNVQPGVLTEVAVTPTILNTTPQAIYDFSPEERNCYVDSEFQFKYVFDSRRWILIQH